MQILSKTLPRASALALALFFGAVAEAQSPFQAGLRWTHQAPAAQPWIPSAVTFTGADNLGFVAAKGSPSRVMALDSEGPLWHSPRFQDMGVAGSVGSMRVVAAGADRQFTIAQYAAPNVYQRRTEVTRHDAIFAARGGAFAPLWYHDLGVLSNGPSRVGADAAGALVVAAVWCDTNSQVRLDWIDGDTGALIARRDVPGAALNALAVSANGERVALTAGLDMYVFDGAGQQRFYHRLSDATQALELAADGRRIAVGGRGQLAVFDEDDRGAIAPFTTFDDGASQYALRAGLSADGETLAVAWWNGVNGVDVRFDLWDLATLRRLRRILVPGTVGGLQNMPVAARVSADGRRALFASWGNDDDDPEVLLVDRDQEHPVMAIDLPGSPQSVALDSTGTRVLVGHKDTHANVPATTGAVRLFDTGERELQLLETPEIGGQLRLVGRHPAQGNVFFLLGERAAPTLIGGVGLLHLDRPTMNIYTRASDASGRADFQQAIPADWALVGTSLATQLAWRVPGAIELGTTVLDPLILNP